MTNGSTFSLTGREAAGSWSQSSSLYRVNRTALQVYFSIPSKTKQNKMKKKNPNNKIKSKQNKTNPPTKQPTTTTKAHPPMSRFSLCSTRRGPYLGLIDKTIGVEMRNRNDCIYWPFILRKKNTRNTKQGQDQITKYTDSTSLIVSQNQNKAKWSQMCQYFV